MKKNLLDNKTMHQLETIQSISMETYLNVKMNIGATYQSLTIETMEKTFLHWQELYWHNTNYRIYQIAPGFEGIVGYYLQKNRKNIAESYLIVAPDNSHAALYHCNEQKYIIARRNLFKQADVEDVLQTFGEYLLPVPEGFPDSVNFDAECDETSAKVYDLPDFAGMLDYDREGK